MTEFSPKEIAQFIFSDMPNDTINKLQLIENDIDCEYIFQILINILLEGIEIKGYLYKNFISQDDIYILNQYMNSLGFTLHMKSFDSSNNIYCFALYDPNLKFIINKNFEHSDQLNQYKCQYLDYIIYFSLNV